MRLLLLPEANVNGLSLWNVVHYCMEGDFLKS